MLADVAADLAEGEEWHQHDKHNEPDHKNLDRRFAPEMGHGARETAAVQKPNGDFLKGMAAHQQDSEHSRA